jgi:MATE family multidrug resistance protein
LWFGYLAEVINTIFIGTLNDEVLITSLGLGNMTINTAVLSILIGLSSTLETLIPQAYGAKNIRLCGIYTQRGMLICSMAFAILVVILNFGSTAFFRIAKQDESVQENA